MLAALEEVDVARYLEEHQYWPDGVPMAGHDGRFVTDVNYHDYRTSPYYAAAHDQIGHSYASPLDHYTTSVHDYLTTAAHHVPVHHGISSPYIHQHKTVHDVTHDTVAHHIPKPHAPVVVAHHANDIDLNAAEEDDSPSKTIININGPVIISGDSADLASLIRQAMD